MSLHAELDLRRRARSRVSHGVPKDATVNGPLWLTPRPSKEPLDCCWPTDNRRRGEAAPVVRLKA